MKKWYQWFYLSLAFLVGGIVNYFAGKRIVAAVMQVCITLILGFIQFLCDQNGDKGKKVFKYIDTSNCKRNYLAIQALGKQKFRKEKLSVNIDGKE